MCAIGKTYYSLKSETRDRRKKPIPNTYKLLITFDPLSNVAF